MPQASTDFRTELEGLKAFPGAGGMAWMWIESGSEAGAHSMSTAPRVLRDPERKSDE